MRPEFGPFAGLGEYSKKAFDALSGLEIGPDGFWLLDTMPIEAQGDFEVTTRAHCHQMILDGIPQEIDAKDVIDLDGSFAEQMFELAKLCNPGPFAEKTNEIGPFIGIVKDDRLIAMMGERFRMPSFTEMTALSTHPDYRGRGFGAMLFTLTARKILKRGDTPFLHVYAENDKGIKLYESLGFKFRSEIYVTILKKK
jgi:GNAT superfamily N-acetyltransferase